MTRKQIDCFMVSLLMNSPHFSTQALGSYAPAPHTSRCSAFLPRSSTRPTGSSQWEWLWMSPGSSCLPCPRRSPRGLRYCQTPDLWALRPQCCKCEVIWGHWPQVASWNWMTMSWPNHVQILSFASMASRQGAVKHGFVSKIAGGCSSYDVIAPCPDLTWSFFFTKSCARFAP